MEFTLDVLGSQTVYDVRLSPAIGPFSKLHRFIPRWLKVIAMARTVMVAREKSGHSAVPQHKTDWARSNRSPQPLNTTTSRTTLPSASFFSLSASGVRPTSTLSPKKGMVLLLPFGAKKDVFAPTDGFATC